jgi:hypothetical protein
MAGTYDTRFVDVSVCHPTSPQRILKNMLPRTATDRTLHALEALEHLKTRKYRELADQQGATFVPFACDIYGGMGERAYELIEWFVREAAINGCLSDSSDRRVFRAEAYHRLSVAIQRAAAIGAADAARRIRARSAPSVV